MINLSAEHEPIADKSNASLSTAALEFASLLGGALARQWIQEQADANHSARTDDSDASPDTGIQLTRSE